MVTFAQKPSASGEPCPGFPDPLFQGTWSLTFTRGFVLGHITGGEPSDPMHPEQEAKVGAYDLRISVYGDGRTFKESFTIYN